MLEIYATLCAEEAIGQWTYITKKTRDLSSHPFKVKEATQDEIAAKGKLHWPLKMAYQATDIEDNKQLKGFFYLGWDKVESEKSLVKALAEGYLYSNKEEYEPEEINNLFGEFLNALVGHTVSRWEAHGLATMFWPPQGAEGNVPFTSNSWFIELHFSPTNILYLALS